MTEKDIEPGQPYIVGTFTHDRIYRMKKVIEFLLITDPKRKQVVQQFNGDEKSIQNHYRMLFQHRLEKSVPYKVFFDRTLKNYVDASDCLYLHNDIVKPGPHSYFIF